MTRNEFLYFLDVMEQRLADIAGQVREGDDQAPELLTKIVNLRHELKKVAENLHPQDVNHQENDTPRDSDCSSSR